MNSFIRSAALVLLIPVFALAQTEAGMQQPTPAADASDPRALSLSLQEAIATAVERNLGVQLERYDYRITGQSAKGAYAPFDWFTSAELSTSSSEQPSFAIVFPSKTERTAFDLGLQHTFAAGGTVGAAFNNDLTNDDRFEDAGVKDVYGSSLGFSVNQPLLRNFGIDVNRRGIYIARNNLDISGEQFRNQLMLTVLGVEQAYWDLIYARQELEVQRASLVLGRDQARITQIRIDVGASAPLDILQPQVAIATREETVILAEAAIRDAEDRLRSLINMDPSEWDRPIVPTETIDYQPVQLDLENAVSRALEQRPEVKQIDLLRQNNRAQYVWARNQVLPRLDFNLNYGLTGQVAGEQILRDPVTGQPIGTASSGISDSLQQVFGLDFPGWTVGLEFGLPIQNIGARAEARRAELDLDRAGTEIEFVRQNVVLEVRAAARDIDTAVRSISATRVARDAAQRNLEAERKRFENGMTTNFNVLLIQQDLADARSREIRSLAAYKKAVATFRRVVGDNLDAHGIVVAMPETFDLPDHRFEDATWLRHHNPAKDLKK
jgi:HAE1 family hydrophobic/amphiphilic exporter-1